MIIGVMVMNIIGSVMYFSFVKIEVLLIVVVLYRLFGMDCKMFVEMRKMYGNLS